MNKDNKVQVTHPAAGVVKFPAGKLALQTNINFNNGCGADETSDIRIMQHDTKTLKNCDFIVDQFDGVFSVVNKISQPHSYPE